MLSHALHSARADDVLYLVPTICHDLPHILSLLNSPPTSFHFHDNRVYGIGTCPVSVINYIISPYSQVLLWKLSSILNVTTYKLLAWSW